MSAAGASSSRVRLAVLIAGLVAGGVEVAAAFLPWVRTGERERNSFELIGVARRLHVLQSAWEQPASAAWYFVPFVVALALVAAAIGRRAVAGALLAVAGLAGALVGLAVAGAPLGVLPGLRVTIVSAVGAGAAGVAVLALEVRRR
jgi:hypothetical protein